MKNKLVKSILLSFSIMFTCNLNVMATIDWSDKLSFITNFCKDHPEFPLSIKEKIYKLKSAIIDYFDNHSREFKGLSIEEQEVIKNIKMEISKKKK